MKKENKHIKCTVEDCEYNNCDCNYCTLDEIKVCHCNLNDDKESTMCDSYKCKDKTKKEDEN